MKKSFFDNGMVNFEDKPNISGIESYSALAIFEALLFSSDEPLTATRVREVVPELKGFEVRKLVEELNEIYRQGGRPYRIDTIAEGFQLFTLPEYAPYVERLHAKRQQARLSARALETLAIVAYKQPVTRHDIEEIRGVSVDGVLKTLLSRNLITIAGTADAPGNPFIYKTTRQFLEYFGLKSLKELPKLKELDEIVEADSEAREKFGDAFLKEIAPEILGMKEHGISEGNEESQEHHPDE
ncbi:MAG: SMC-Scp complex subunit ScpB [Calditrichia bacterium]|nr:SMC-Scp complex subunit ScpB [Calditrichia bacterium]